MQEAFFTDREPVSVTRLNEYVSGLLSRDPLLKGLRVTGEISGFKRHSSGHLYFSLKDEGALVRCVMFKQAAMGLFFRPADGMRVVLGGYAALYARDGQFQLYAQTLEEEGEGELYKKFLLLKTRLQAKGYFEAARKRLIPFLPKCVGIVTSQTGAAVHDIIETIRNRFPVMDILLCPVAVQGEGASKEIAAGIRAINRDGRAEVMIVGRGGGSMEDLWAFNELAVAQAIYESAVPVISAVGHETDFTIADFVADARAATPTAAATMCVPEYDTLLQRTDQAAYRLSRALGLGVEAKAQKVGRLLQSPGFSSLPHKISMNGQRLEQRHSSMAHCLERALKARVSTLDTLLGRLSALGPDAVLKRGFGLVEDGSGGVVTSIQALAPGMAVRLRLRDGAAMAHIDTEGLTPAEGDAT